MRKDSIINEIFIVIIIVIIIFIAAEIYQEQKKEREANEFLQLLNYQQANGEQNIKTNEPKAEAKKYHKANVIEEYKGYKVCAKIEIPKIELETYILGSYSKEALDVSPTKFWGPNPNQIGNFCIAGHNFRNKNMFGNFKKLNIKDKIILSDNNIGIVEYEIFNIDKVLPDSTECLLQQTNGERHITLITCTGNSQKRIIIKAKEIKK